MAAADVIFEGRVANLERAVRGVNGDPGLVGKVTELCNNQEKLAEQTKENTDDIGVLERTDVALRASVDQIILDIKDLRNWIRGLLGTVLVAIVAEIVLKFVK